MKYLKKYIDENDGFEVTKEEARRTLEGWWKNEALDDIFDNNKSFRLHTAYAVVWTNKDGLEPIAGFYGVVG